MVTIFNIAACDSDSVVPGPRSTVRYRVHLSPNTSLTLPGLAPTPGRIWDFRSVREKRAFLFLLGSPS
eukprot:5734998-Pyramimonas_sp.AAC.2